MAVTTNARCDDFQNRLANASAACSVASRRREASLASISLLNGCRGLMLHRTRQLFIRQQTSVINAIRAHMAEFGIVAPVGRQGVEALLEDPRGALWPAVM